MPSILNHERFSKGNKLIQQVISEVRIYNKREEKLGYVLFILDFWLKGETNMFLVLFVSQFHKTSFMTDPSCFCVLVFYNIYIYL